MIDQKSVSISAAIEDTRVTIFGYTSPAVRVELTSPKVFAVAYSDTTGYFIFDKTLLPKNPSELCLSSIDDNGRRSTPVCTPAPPATNYHTDTGPIILPPTFTLDSHTASGQSVPNSPIDIHLYQISNQAPLLVKPAQAFELPIFSITSDSQGNYSFSLPTAYASNYRLYSTVKYLDQPSPKSNTLIYHLPSPTVSYLLLSFYSTLLLFIILLYLYFKSKKHFYPALFSYPLQTHPPFEHPPLTREG